MTHADLQSKKIELAQIILNTQDESLIQKIKDLIETNERDFWLNLTSEQKEEIEISRNQFKNGEVEEWSVLKKKL